MNYLFSNPCLSTLDVYFYVTVQRDVDGRTWLLRIWERHLKMSGFSTSEMFTCCCSYRMWCRFKLFPIFTFSLLQMLCARSPYFSLKNHSFKEDGTIYLYICLYEYSIECFISILQNNKVNYTGSWNKHRSNLVKIGCSVKIQGEYIGNPRDKSQVACMMDC